jgi:hypothetical protein
MTLMAEEKGTQQAVLVEQCLDQGYSGQQRSGPIFVCPTCWKRKSRKKRFEDVVAAVDAATVAAQDDEWSPLIAPSTLSNYNKQGRKINSTTP